MGEFASRLKTAVSNRRAQAPTTQERKDTSSSEEESDEDDWIGSSAAKRASEISRKLSVRSNKSIKSTDPALNNSAVSNGRRLSFAPAEFRPKAEHRHSKEFSTIEELFEAEAGKPCVLNGVCTICGYLAGKTAWGNPKCRGCSVVDSLDFKHHPFRALLVESTQSAPKPAHIAGEFPKFIERCNLSPPLLGSLGQMYRNEFGHL